jgi:hypothetical protein
MSTIDLGAGQTVARRHVPAGMLHQFDQASAALSAVQRSIRSSVQLIAMQAPANFNGTIICGAPGQSSLSYNLPEVGGAMLVNARDVATFTNLGFVAVPTALPVSGLRAGIVYFDEPASEYLRYSGAGWAPITLT